MYGISAIFCDLLHYYLFHIVILVFCVEHVRMIALDIQIGQVAEQFQYEKFIVKISFQCI